MSTRFPDLVAQAFSFLESTGFRRTKADRDSVTYESSRAFVIVSWNPRSGELDAGFGLIPRTGTVPGEYSLADILGYAGLPPTDCKPAQVVDEARVRPFVEKLASHVRDYAQPALAGDEAYFRCLDAFSAANAASHGLDTTLRLVRSDAARAWQDRHFDRVVSLYAAIEEHLTRSEIRKLGYARKYSGGASGEPGQDVARLG